MGREGSRRFLGVAVAALFTVLVVETEGANITGTVTSRFRDKCRPERNKLTPCMAYATEKADEPTEECCRNVKDIISTIPACICYILLKANCAQEAVFSPVVSMKRLVKLPETCRINTPYTVALCPVVLGIPEDSPDHAIFDGSAPSNKSIECKLDYAFGVRSSNAATGLALAAFSAIFSSVFAL